MKSSHPLLCFTLLAAAVILVGRGMEAAVYLAIVACVALIGVMWRE